MKKGKRRLIEQLQLPIKVFVTFETEDGYNLAR